MLHNLATSVFVASILMGCSSPPQQSYTIGSKVYQTETAAEAALTDAGSRQVSDNSSPKKIRFLRAPMPRMPAEAFRADLNDRVTVDILFNEAGEVERVVPKNYKHPMFLEAVLAVVRDWKIEPSVEAGKRVKTMAEQSFEFKLE
jgi:outer membrane biosynthesis protein TonB